MAVPTESMGIITGEFGSNGDNARIGGNGGDGEGPKLDIDANAHGENISGGFGGNGGNAHIGGDGGDGEGPKVDIDPNAARKMNVSGGTGGNGGNGVEVGGKGGTGKAPVIRFQRRAGP
ncbi:hypothetical protein B0H13DRAFT_1857463 [Mycena leptocephala]|nr:hypothetical protein B0H13DRAFT_1857463 [Mycena leptocephala]